jgi:hypothetical protein
MVASLTEPERRRLAGELLARFFHDCDECDSFGYQPTVFRQMLAEHGPVETARMVIMSADIPVGLAILFERGRLDLTTEAKVLSGRFCRLFDKELLIRARSRLRRYGYPDLTCPCLDASP